MTLQEIVAAKQLAYDTLVEQTALAIFSARTELEKAKTDLAVYLSTPRITVAVLNQSGLPEERFKIYIDVLRQQIALLKTKWPLPEVDVVTVPTKGAWEVAITTENRRERADGWHFYGPTGLPYAYVLPGGPLYPYGTYRPRRFRTLVGKVFRGRDVPEYLRSGALTVLVHETLEMLIDPIVRTASKPDSKGRKWLIEVCSTSVFGTYYMEKIAGKLCILPNISYPSAYDLDGVAPFDYMGVLKEPFTVTPKSYPYELTDDGKLLKIYDAVTVSST